MITQISDKGTTFIKRFEGIKLKAYKDVKGVWTIGIGHTKDVKAGQTCTVAEAYRWMREDLAPVERYVAKMMPNVRQWQMDALCSFAYNVGLGNLQKSTLLRLCLHGAPSDQIEREFQKWNHAGGKVVDGLTRRRKAEAKLYTKGLYA